MIKRLAFLILTLSLTLLATGCSAMFKDDYLSIEEYQEESLEAAGGVNTTIRSYSELKNAVAGLVNRHEETGKLRFSGYADDIETDLKQACDEARAGTPLASYIVDFISYDLSRIVSYYEADIYITYRRTPEQVASIITLTGNSSLQEQLEKALKSFGDTLAVRVSGKSITPESIARDVREIFLSAPLEVIVLPEVKVSEYTGMGMQKILEIAFDYGIESSLLTGLREQLHEKVDELIVLADTGGGDPALLARNVYTLLSEVEYAPEKTQTGMLPGESEFSGSAYGALVEGKADSVGLALAYKAVCDRLEIECLVVEGHIDRIDRCWNIVKIEEYYYHLDLTAAEERGGDFLCSDGQLWGRYIWSVEDYPECDGPLSLREDEPSAEGEEGGQETE